MWLAVTASSRLASQKACAIAPPTVSPPHLRTRGRVPPHRVSLVCPVMGGLEMTGGYRGRSGRSSRRISAPITVLSRVLSHASPVARSARIRSLRVERSSGVSRAKRPSSRRRVQTKKPRQRHSSTLIHSRTGRQSVSVAGPRQTGQGWTGASSRVEWLRCRRLVLFLTSSSARPMATRARSCCSSAASCRSQLRQRMCEVSPVGDTRYPPDRTGFEQRAQMGSLGGSGKDRGSMAYTSRTASAGLIRHGRRIPAAHHETSAAPSASRDLQDTPGR